MCTLTEIYKDATGTFNQRYIIHKYLAIGGMSVVFKVKDMYREYFNDQKELVIKIPSRELLDKKDIDAFIYSEYTFLRDIEHNNIVKVYDYGIDNETKIPFIVMEFLKGRLLEQTPIHTLQQDQKLFLFHSLFDTLNYIHEKGIIHADITPKNIVISQEQKATIFDFGISQVVDDVKDFGLDYRQIKAYNPKYTAPEILQGGVPTISSDLFSFALVFYEVFVGELPFYKDSLELIEKPLTLSNCSNKIPLLLQNWFINVLVIDPKKRKRTLPFFYNLLKKTKII